MKIFFISFFLTATILLNSPTVQAMNEEDSIEMFRLSREGPCVAYEYVYDDEGNKLSHKFYGVFTLLTTETKTDNHCFFAAIGQTPEDVYNKLINNTENPSIRQCITREIQYAMRALNPTELYVKKFQESLEQQSSKYTNLFNEYKQVAQTLLSSEWKESFRNNVDLNETIILEECNAIQLLNNFYEKNQQDTFSLYIKSFKENDSVGVLLSPGTFVNSDNNSGLVGAICTAYEHNLNVWTVDPKRTGSPRQLTKVSSFTYNQNNPTWNIGYMHPNHTIRLVCGSPREKDINFENQSLDLIRRRKMGNNN